MEMTREQLVDLFKPSTVYTYMTDQNGRYVEVNGGIYSNQTEPPVGAVVCPSWQTVFIEGFGRVPRRGMVWEHLGDDRYRLSFIPGVSISDSGYYIHLNFPTASVVFGQGDYGNKVDINTAHNVTGAPEKIAIEQVIMALVEYQAITAGEAVKVMQAHNPISALKILLRTGEI